MTLYSSLEDSIRNVTLVALSDFINPPVIFSHLSGLEPAESFVVINILNQTQIGHKLTSTALNTNGKLSFQVAYEVMVQFSFIGSQSGEMAYSFNQRINNSDLTLQALTLNHLGVMRKSAVRRAPQKRDTIWVEYQNMDVTFSYIVVTQETVDPIDSVVVEDVLRDYTFTIPPSP